MNWKPDAVKLLFRAKRAMGFDFRDMGTATYNYLDHAIEERTRNDQRKLVEVDDVRAVIVFLALIAAGEKNHEHTD